jgi:lipoprotein-releasing system permease protein
MQTGLFKASADLPFPVKIVGYNYLIVLATASVFGLAVSWIFSKINKENLTVS